MLVLLTDFEFKLLVNYLINGLLRRYIYGGRESAPPIKTSEIALGLNRILEEANVKITEEQKARVITAVEEKI